MENLVEIRGLKKWYGDFCLWDVDLTVPAGAIVGFIGENGAGKTTAIRALLHMIQPDGGAIRLFGRDPSDHEARAEAAAVLDSCPFPPSLCARQLDRIFADLGRWDSAYFRMLCRRLQVPEWTEVKSLSKGAAMKLNLAVALARRPRLLVLDEPTSSLDPVVREEVLELLLEFMQDETHGVLISSHITSDLERIADQIVYLRQGHILFQRDKDALLEDTAIVRASRADIESLPPDLAVAVRRGSFGDSALVHHPGEVRRLLPEAVVDRATLDEIMQYYSEGRERP